MRVLTVPNWSFGRDRALLREAKETLSMADVQPHFCESDVDHNRTVTAFSGELEAVFSTLQRLCGLILERIDLSRHMGAHPRIGALDVCPLVLLEPTSPEAEQACEARLTQFAEEFAREFQTPVFLYEKSERGRHEADLPTLRKGGFGSLIGRELSPDYGPATAHPRLGVTVMGRRGFLIAMNVNLAASAVSLARAIAADARRLRQEGDARFLGVRTLGLALASRGMSQVSFNLTLPDLTPPDPVIEFVALEASKRHVAVAGTELIGVIRESDLLGASRLPIARAQIVRGV